MRILRMTMNHSQIQKKNNFQPEDQISAVYKNGTMLVMRAQLRQASITSFPEWTRAATETSKQNM